MENKKLSFKQKMIKKNLIKLLKMSKKEFYDDEGKVISAEEFADKVLSLELKDALELQKEIKKRKEIEKDEQNN